MHHQNSIDVSGIGLVTPYGHEIDHIIMLKQKQMSHMPITQEALTATSSPRHLKKIDKFTAISITAIKSAFDMAKLGDDTINTGMVIGNVFGGWHYVEESMYDLSKGDFSAINPYVATAWFPAAPQGEVSILHGYGGYSKTISADTISAAFAIEHGIHLIREKKLNYVCCGGAEAPVTPILINALHSSETVLCDASAFFCLSTNDNAEYKFTIESIIISRDIKKCLSIYANEKFNIHNLVLSENIDMNILNIDNMHTYSTDAILGCTYGAAFGLDLYIAYLAALINKGKTFILRKSTDGQYAACLISIKPNNTKEVSNEN